MDRKKLFSVEEEVALHPEKVKFAPQHEALPEAPAEEKDASSIQIADPHTLRRSTSS